MTKDNFTENLIADLKKEAVLMHLSKDDFLFNLKDLSYLKNLGYNFTSKENLKQFVTYLLKMDKTGIYKNNFIAGYQNTIFFLEEENNCIKNIHASYVTYNKSLIDIKECIGKTIVCDNNNGKNFTFECINQNEFNLLENKTCYALVSCFADKVNIISKDNVNKTNSLSGKVEEYICDGPYAKYISGEILECKKILNVYSNKMFYEIIINCCELKIAVIISEDKINEKNITKGKILRCSGFVTAIINEIYSKAIDKSLILHATAKAKNYYVCITKNKNGLMFLNLNNDGQINDNNSYAFNTLDIKLVKLKKIYNGIFNVKLIVKVKNGKGFSCYVKNSFAETLELLNDLDYIKIDF